MAFRILNNIAGVSTGLLFAFSATGQTVVGDWSFQANSGSDKSRVASTAAQAVAGVGQTPELVIRQKKPGSPIEMLVIGTHDKDADKCDYKDWKVSVDATDVPVLGYTFAPARTVLKAKLGGSKDQLWKLFRQGVNLDVRATQQCDSYTGASKEVNYTFSLRGSSAAYLFVQGKPD